MTDYITEVQTEKKFTPNVVIRIGSTYFGIRQPDSGLTLPAYFRNAIESLVLNPTTIDIQKVTTTIASYSFTLTDLNQVITRLMLGDGANLLGQQVTIWLGRSNVAMDFAHYFQLPITLITAIDHGGNSYSFTSSEQTQRIDKPIYQFQAAISGDILDSTTEITMRDDLSEFPASGFVKIEDEFLSYASIDSINNRLSGCLRGLLNSTAAAHAADTDAFFVETVTGNPLTLILKLLVSKGGGGTYDTLQSGCAISQTLIDVVGIEALRDELFTGISYTLSLYSLDSALKVIEDELLMPNNLRFSYTQDSSSKLTLVVLDKAKFVDAVDVIDEDTMTEYPTWGVDVSRVINVMTVTWDFDEGMKTYGKFNTYKDAASIATYGQQSPLDFTFKGIKAASDGQTLVDDFANRLLTRLSVPTPVVEVKTQIDKSLQNIAEKTHVESSKIPASDGTLNFASDLEILERSINQETGDVSFKLAFTSFTGIRSCYLAPSDLLKVITSQKVASVGSGRGDLYTAGWAVRLWDVAANDYASDPVNYIASILSDTLTFLNDWTTILTGPDNYRLKFADYDDCVATQKRYCFLSESGANFSDGKPTYKVTF